MTYTAYFDRRPETIEGVFTLQDAEGKAIFRRLPARSGQRGHTGTSWTRGKSPIPFGTHYLWLQPVNVGTRAGKTGVGEFFPISNDSGSQRVIWDQSPQPVEATTPKRQRWDVGLHEENAKEGSAGCIVLLTDTPERLAQVQKLYAYLRSLGRTQPHIRLVVL